MTDTETANKPKIGFYTIIEEYPTTETGEIYLKKTRLQEKQNLVEYSKPKIPKHWQKKTLPF